jgi:hypothetical protein
LDATDEEGLTQMLREKREELAAWADLEMPKQAIMRSR